MRTEGQRFGIRSSKTLRKAGFRTEVPPCQNKVTKDIVTAIKARHEEKIRKTLPPTASEEIESLQKQKNAHKKRTLKNQKRKDEHQPVYPEVQESSSSCEEEREDEWIPINLPLSTYDQVLLNATEAEKRKLNQAMKLRAVDEGKYLFDRSIKPDSKRNNYVKEKAQETRRRENKKSIKAGINELSGF